MIEPVACANCGGQPLPRAIEVYYTTPRKRGRHEMVRMECRCGMIGKCRPTVADAIETWNEPWQALVGREYLTVPPA